MFLDEEDRLGSDAEVEQLPQKRRARELTM
jgi:hypothetical protein